MCNTIVRKKTYPCYVISQSPLWNARRREWTIGEKKSARICSSDLFSRCLFSAPVTHCVSDNLKCDRLMWSGLKILHHIHVLDRTQEVFTDNDIIVCPVSPFHFGPVDRHMNTIVRCLFRQTLSLNHKPRLNSLGSLFCVARHQTRMTRSSRLFDKRFRWCASDSQTSFFASLFHFSSISTSLILCSFPRWAAHTLLTLMVFESILRLFLSKFLGSFASLFSSKRFIGDVFPFFLQLLTLFSRTNSKSVWRTDVSTSYKFRFACTNRSWICSQDLRLLLRGRPVQLSGHSCPGKFRKWSVSDMSECKQTQHRFPVQTSCTIYQETWPRPLATQTHPVPKKVGLVHLLVFCNVSA